MDDERPSSVAVRRSPRSRTKEDKFMYPSSYQESEILTWKRLTLICLALDASIFPVIHTSMNSIWYTFKEWKYTLNSPANSDQWYANYSLYMVSSLYLIGTAVVPFTYMLIRALLQLSCCNMYLSTQNYRYYARFSTLLRIITLILLLRVIIGMELEYRSLWTIKQSGWHYGVASIILVILSLVCTTLLSTNGMYSEDRALVPGSIPSRIIIHKEASYHNNPHRNSPNRRSVPVTTDDRTLGSVEEGTLSSSSSGSLHSFGYSPARTAFTSAPLPPAASSSSYSSSPLRLIHTSSPFGTPNQRMMTNTNSAAQKYDYLQTYKPSSLHATSSPGLRKGTKGATNHVPTYTTSSPLRQRMSHTPTKPIINKVTNTSKHPYHSHSTDPQLEEPVTIVDANGASSIEFAAALYAGDVQAMAKAAIGIVTNNGSSPVRSTENLTRTITDSILPSSSSSDTKYASTSTSVLNYEPSIEQNEPFTIIPLVRRQPIHNNRRLSNGSNTTIVYPPPLTVPLSSSTEYVRIQETRTKLGDSLTTSPIRPVLRPSINIDNIPVDVPSITAIHPNPKARRLSNESIPSLRRSTFVQSTNNLSTNGTIHPSPLRPLPVFPFGTKKYSSSPRTPREGGTDEGFIDEYGKTRNGVLTHSLANTNNAERDSSSSSLFTVPRNDTIGKENVADPTVTQTKETGVSANRHSKSYIIDPSSPSIHTTTNDNSAADTGFTVPSIHTHSLHPSHNETTEIPAPSVSSSYFSVPPPPPSSVPSTATHTPITDFLTTAPPTPEAPLSTAVPSRRTSNGSIYVISTQGLAGIHALLAKAPKGTIPLRNPHLYSSAKEMTNPVDDGTGSSSSSVTESLYDWNAFTDIDENTTNLDNTNVGTE